MAWMEKNFNSNPELVKQALEKRFEEKYNRHNIDGRFLLPDGSAMEIDILRWETESSFVMDYKSEMDWDDGDQYYPSDYDSFDELFAAMLAETQRVENDF